MNDRIRFLRFSGLVLSLKLSWVLWLTGCTTIYNPATERREFIAISTEQEVAMGKNIHREIVGEFGLLSRADKLARIRGIGQRLAQVSDRRDYQYNFYLIDKKDFNAFTTPGGNIYFYNGLLERLKTDDEIAAVLAHEMGHCAARHTVKKFQAAMGYNLIAALIFNQVELDNQAQATATLASSVAMQLVMSAYSRQDEYEADRLGVKYMYLAGYDLNGMIKTLEILKKESEGAAVPLILRTHPYLDDRVKAVKVEIREVPLKYTTKGHQHKS